MEATCKKCGAAIGASGKFCMKCGTPVQQEENAAPSSMGASEKADIPEIDLVVSAKMPEETVQEVPPVVSDEQSVQYVSQQEKAAGTKYKKCSKAATALAVLLCFFALLFGLASNGLFFVRLFSDKLLKDGIANRIDLTEVESELFEEAVINGVQLKGESVSEMVSGYLLEEGVHVSAEEIEDLMQADFVKDFLNEKSADYYEDFLHQTGTGVITEKEIAGVIEDNLDEIQEKLDINIDKKDIERVEEYLEENIELSEVTSLSNVMEQVDFPINLVSMFISLPLLIVLAVVCLLLFFGVFLVKGRPLRGMRPVGITVTILGVFNIALFILAGQLPGILNNVVAIGEKVYTNIFTPLKSISMITGCIMLGVGVLFIVVGSIVVAVADRKYRNQ